MKKNFKKGFTLIELIVVMIIIGILVLLATPRFINYIRLARYTNIINDTRVVETVALPDMVRHNMKFPIGTSEYPVKVEDFLKAVKEDKAYMRDGLLRTDLEKDSKEFPLVGHISKWKILEPKGRISLNLVKDGETGLEGFYRLDKKQWVKPEVRTRLPGEFLLDKEGNAVYVDVRGFGEEEKPKEKTLNIRAYIMMDRLEKSEEGLTYKSNIYRNEEFDKVISSTNKDLTIDEKLIKDNLNIDLDGLGLRYGGIISDDELSNSKTIEENYNLSIGSKDLITNIASDLKSKNIYLGNTDAKTIELKEDRENTINIIFINKFQTGAYNKFYIASDSNLKLYFDDEEILEDFNLRQTENLYESKLTYGAIYGYSFSEARYIEELRGDTYKLILPLDIFSKEFLEIDHNDSHGDNIKYKEDSMKKYPLNIIEKGPSESGNSLVIYNLDGNISNKNIDLDMTRAKELVFLEDNSLSRLKLQGSFKLNNNKKLRKIGEKAFSNSNFDAIDFSENKDLRLIGSNAFSESQISSGSLDFSHNIKLKKLDGFFRAGESMENFSLIVYNQSDGVLEDIGEFAFNAAKLDELYLDKIESLKYIREYAFESFKPGGKVYLNQKVKDTISDSDGLPENIVIEYR